jgi:formate hydrogenlyase transcriptional activator
MSAVECVLTPPSTFMSAILPVGVEQPGAALEALVARYEKASYLSQSIASMTFENLSLNLVSILRPIFPCDFAELTVFHHQSRGNVYGRTLDGRRLLHPDIPIEETTVWSVYQERKPLWVEDWQQDERPNVRKEAESTAGAGYRSLCRLPLRTHEGCAGVLSLATSRPYRYSDHEIRLLLLVSTQVAMIVDNFQLRAELQELKIELEGGKSCVDDEVLTEPSFEGIVGCSPALQRVLRDAEIVAPTDSSVLIQGETGTGKELIAQAIHNRSTRRDRPFIKVNCAAIPSGLLESELFGHEKGAFTGAVIRKPGRFEVADKGTIFLDEVGDIPLELQSKLLRVLQEHEFERLGSTRTQQVDVRIIAATHRDLKKMVEEGTFRSDLYYRLHVFPVMVPPLREHRADVPLLVRHYVEKYARRMNRCIDMIPTRAMEVLANYSWPGNVRELQNFVERAVILSSGRWLRAPLEELKQNPPQNSRPNLEALEEMEREHVLRTLRECNWVTGGPNGAAVRLGMKRTTLAYRIRKLNIPCRPE